MRKNQHLRERIKSSRWATAAALPLRARLVARHTARQLKLGSRWLVTSREHENFTYDLTEINLRTLAWFVSSVSGVSVVEAQSYLSELEADAQLRAHLEREARTGSQPGLADTAAKYGRRAGWYALVRATRPNLVVETGTDKGLGTCVIAAALLRNGAGKVITIDVDPAAGHLIKAPYNSVADVHLGDSIRALESLTEPVDIFLHDSLHTADHERAEFVAVAPSLSPHALVMSDNAHVTLELSDWAAATGRRYLYFDERPQNHWYPGGGIGVAFAEPERPRLLSSPSR